MLTSRIRVRLWVSVCLVGVASNFDVCLHPQSAFGQAPAVVGAGVPVQASLPEAFEVISIRKSKLRIPSGRGYTPDGFKMESTSCLALVMTAYNFMDLPRTSGVADWCRTEFFDVDAKVAEEDIPRWKKASMRQPNPALQALLRDRFGLRAHMEFRDVLVYELVVDKNQSKLKEATQGEIYPDGFTGGDGKPRSGVFPKQPDRILGQAAKMADLANYLRGVLGHPVLDKTGLTSQYDFILPVEFNLPTDDVASQLFSVVRDSLGLRLVPTKAPTQFLVVDHMDRPTPN